MDQDAGAGLLNPYAQSKLVMTPYLVGGHVTKKRLKTVLMQLTAP